MQQRQLQQGKETHKKIAKERKKKLKKKQKRKILKFYILMSFIRSNIIVPCTDTLT